MEERADRVIADRLRVVREQRRTIFVHDVFLSRSSVRAGRKQNAGRGAAAVCRWLASATRRRRGDSDASILGTDAAMREVGDRSTPNQEPPRRNWRWVSCDPGDMHLTARLVGQVSPVVRRRHTR